MFGWAIFSLVIAIVAALYGFGGWSRPLESLALAVFVVGLILFLVLLIMGRLPPRH